MENDLKEKDIYETPVPVPISFSLSASHPSATKAVKTGWEAGDAVFVFFTGSQAPNDLKMTFDGSTWASAEYNGATQADGALGLKDGDTGTMRAVYLPFWSGATVSDDGTDFVFSTTYYAYYLTATLEYTVADNEVSGSFDMTIPEGYVQFFINSDNVEDGAYTLGTDAVIPVGVASIAADGTLVETSDKTFPTTWSATHTAATKDGAMCSAASWWRITATGITEMSMLITSPRRTSTRIPVRTFSC